MAEDRRTKPIFGLITSQFEALGLSSRELFEPLHDDVRVQRIELHQSCSRRARLPRVSRRVAEALQVACGVGPTRRVELQIPSPQPIGTGFDTNHGNQDRRIDQGTGRHQTARLAGIVLHQLPLRAARKFVRRATGRI
jgi:hypothetical protein